MSIADNVIAFPPRGNPHSSAKKRASAELQYRFRQGHGVTKEVYEHLARRVPHTLDVLRQRLGQRSGAMQRAFGDNLLKQKRRFTLEPGEETRAVCQNAGHWLQLLKGLASELSEDADVFILDVFSGSPLLPTRTSADHSREAWSQTFDDLLENMNAAIITKTEFMTTWQYLFDSALAVEGSRMEWVEQQDDDSYIDDRFVYSPRILGRMPFIAGVAYRKEYYDDLPLDDPTISFAVSAARGEECLPAEGVIVLEGGTRYGLAFAVDAESQTPRLALVEWRLVSVSVQSSEEELNSSVLKHYWDQLVPPDSALGKIPADTIRFSFLGTERFQEIAASQIVFPDNWLDPDEHAIWDPGGYVDTAPNYPTNAPARTVAAAIERNLLYAAAEGRRDERLDLLLTEEAMKIERLVRTHRSSQRAGLEAATATLHSEWQTYDGKKRNENEAAGSD